MADRKPLTDDDRADLIAYLDGELHRRCPPPGRDAA